MELSFTNNDEFVEDQIQAFSMRTKWEPRRWCFVDANYSRVAGMVAIEGDLLSLQEKMGERGVRLACDILWKLLGLMFRVLTGLKTLHLRCAKVMS